MNMKRDYALTRGKKTHEQKLPDFLLVALALVVVVSRAVNYMKLHVCLYGSLYRYIWYLDELGNLENFDTNEPTH